MRVKVPTPLAVKTEHSQETDRLVAVIEGDSNQDPQQQP